MTRSRGHIARWWIAEFAVAATLLAACGSPEEQGMGTAETGPQADHSAHLSGGAETAERQAVQLSAEHERALGVVFVATERRTLERTIRTVGRIVAAEPRVAEVTPKVSGFVERLFVGTTGEEVRRGQPLLTLYSPDLVAAQEELLTAKRLAERVAGTGTDAERGATDMLEAARRRLAWWDVTEEQIRRLETTAEVTKTMTLVAPVSGVVLEKTVVEGQRVGPGQMLYRLADLTVVWVEGDVFERDLQLVELGAETHIEVSAYPGEHLMGTVSFIYPTVDVRSRTNRMRVTLPNPGFRLKPGMFATVFFEAISAIDAIAIPVDAVLVTGERNLVFVREDDVLVPREVVMGAHAEEYVEILAGLEVGDIVVASANFLIDAESRLSGTGGQMPGMSHAESGSAIEPSEGEADAQPPEHRHD
jgi:Cu(I)/Ag(I) efflux system membrane fusion protein